jgi:hypothetical protein
MIKLPNYEKAFDYENDFYLSCQSSRIAKSIAQHILFEKTVHIEGDVVECGIFKGSSFLRFAMYRKIHNIENKKLIGFDSFDNFPETEYEQDKHLREKFIAEAGDMSISRQQLTDVLSNKNCGNNVSLIPGDITKTVPEFVDKYKDVKISILNIDVDIYEPTVTILEYLFPLLTTGGIMILDDYKVFPGETNAVDEYFNDSGIVVKKPLFVNTPYYVIKQ